jgi:hypothetical protein
MIQRWSGLFFFMDPCRALKPWARHRTCSLHGLDHVHHFPWGLHRRIHRRLDLEGLVVPCSVGMQLSKWMQTWCNNEDKYIYTVYIDIHIFIASQVCSCLCVSTMVISRYGTKDQQWLWEGSSCSPQLATAEDFWLGVVLGSVYVCVVMLLNLNLTLQMFAISNFAGGLIQHQHHALGVSLRNLTFQHLHLKLCPFRVHCSRRIQGKL